MKEQPHVDEHAHTYQKVGNKEGIARKLYAVHERRYMRYEAVEYQSGKEGAVNALQSDGI